MRGFQKGITLGGRTPGSVQKVYGGWWVGGWVVGGLLDFKVYLSPLRGETSRTKSTRQVLDMFLDIFLDIERRQESRRGDRLRQI